MKNHKKGLQVTKRKIRATLGDQYITITAIVFTIIFVLLSYTYLNFQWNKYQDGASSEAIQLAESMEALLHPEHIGELSGSIDDVGTPEYEVVKHSLMRFVERTTDVRFAYLMIQKDGQYIFLVDSETPESPDYSAPGDVYEEELDTIGEVFQLQETVISKPSADQWGTWISVLVPIKEPKSGEMIAVFGIDYPANNWDLAIRKQMISDFIVVFSVFLLYSSFLYIWTQHYRLGQLNKKLVMDEALYRSVFEQAPIGIAVMQDQSHAIQTGIGGMSINPMYEKILGRKKEELANITWADLTHPDDLTEDVQKFEQFKNGEISSYTMKKRYLKSDGSIVWANMKISTLLGLDNDHSMHLCLIEDITQQEYTQKALKESEHRENVIVTHLPGLAYRCKYDENGTMLVVSDGCYKLTGYEPEKFINNRDLPFNDIITPIYRKKLLAVWEEAIQNHLPYECEYEITTATGERKWVIELGEGVYNEEGMIEALEGIILDITDRKSFEDHLQYMGEHDSWTGLYNREYLEKMMEADIKKNTLEKKAVISINLSTVQLLTANYGFHYTQNLVKKAAEILYEYVSDQKMLFKTYENRFVFYIKGYLDKTELTEFANTIGEALERLFISERIAGGIGILEIEQDQHLDVDLLLKRLLIASERSLSIFEKDFRACFYDAELEALVNREREIREELAEIAISNDAGKLYLQYQPILDLKTNSICGFEALARLKTESLGNVSPLEFIAIAERTKLIVAIGEEVFRIALKFLKKLNDEIDQTLGVAINVSAIQLLRPDFTTRLFELIEEARVNPQNIGIEITESVFSANYDDINNIIDELKQKGLSVAIDDFGMGYSSLAREKELSVDCLKIDKYFIDKLLIVSPEKAITSDIISMAHKLEHCAIAEGVEDERQLQYLQKYDCDKAQGYFISRPLNEEVAFEFLQAFKQTKKGL